jgi:hypothetical protein
MTPELKTACELIFQEHKLSNQIKWGKDSFRGQLSIGLSELAKETLVKKKIIFLPNKSKKIITLLNPAVASASNFEEAEGMIANKTQAAVVSVGKEEPIYIPSVVPDPEPEPDPAPLPRYSRQVIPMMVNSPAPVVALKWYFKPVFLYFIWPTCALAAGAAISFLLDYVYGELFLHGR